MRAAAGGHACPLAGCAPAVLAAPTLLRRLSNQSASEPPASSALISRAAGRCDGCATVAEETVGGSEEGKWIEGDEQQEEEEEREERKSEQGKDDTNDAEKNFPIIYHQIIKDPIL